jgi:polyisoprenyl-teichoic acid--peptidoglycan teichoic acid transferase
MKRLAAVILCLLTLMVGVPVVDAFLRPTRASGPLFGRVHETFQPSQGKIFVLAIGNDARSGNPDRSLADAIHILGINTKTMRGGILNFPRDSWVNIPGYGSAKINEALFHGGPELLAKTLENLTGIRIDYWVMVGFEGFQGIVEDLRGVEMHIPSTHNDVGASGSVLKAGYQKLQGYEALAYARARKSFSGGDIARTTHQGDMLIALLRKLRDEATRNPASLFRWIAAARHHARFDISFEEMFRLGIIATQLSSRNVGNVTVPVGLGFMGQASVAFISPSARGIYERFKKNGSL